MNAKDGLIVSMNDLLACLYCVRECVKMDSVFDFAFIV